MSSVQQTSDFVLNIIHPLIQSFLEKMTEEQWTSFITSSADDATKILVVEMILEIIAALSNSILTSLKSQRPKTEERLMSELEYSLTQTFAEALGIPDEVDNTELKTLSSTIQEEVRYVVESGGNAGISKHLTPAAKINAMTNSLIRLFRRCSEKIKAFIAPRPFKKKWRSSKRAGASPNSQAIKNEIDNELRVIMTPLLEGIHNSKELQKEICSDIQKVADEVICSTCGKKSKPSLFQTIRKRAKSVLVKFFTKLCLMRILDQLKKKHSQEPTRNESVEMIVERLASQFAVHRDEIIETDSYTILLRQLDGDKVLVFSQELSKLIYWHTLQEPLPRSILNASQRNIIADTWGKTWLYIVLMNWILTNQVNPIAYRVMLPLMDKNESKMSDKSNTSITGIEKAFREEQDPEKKKTYVKLVIEKTVFTVCSDTSMVPEKRDETINYLTQTVWKNVQDEVFFTHPDVLNNLKKKIRKTLYKGLSSPENVLFLMLHKDPVIVERIMVVVNKTLLCPPKEKSTVCKIFSSLGKTIRKIFKRNRGVFR